MRYSDIDSKYKIDIVSFLRNYAGISGDSIKQNVITHEDILELFPELNLVRIPYSVAYKNPEFVCTGNYLIVYDANNEIVVYSNPLRMNNKVIEEYNNYEDKKERLVLPNLSKLSKDELLSLRRKAEKYNDFRTYGLLTNYIKMAKDREPRRYKREKEELRIRELEEGYEKHKR